MNFPAAMARPKTILWTLLAATALALPCGNSYAAAKPKKKKEVEPLFPATRRDSLPKQPTAGESKPEVPKTPGHSGVSHEVRGLLGFASGLGHVSSAVFVLGADYARGFRPSLDIVGGLVRWNNVYSDSTYSIDHAVTTIDGGAEYRIPVSDVISVRGAGRLGLAISSAATEDVIIGQPESKTSTVTSLVATFGGGVAYEKDRFHFGAEIRKPVFFTELQDPGTILYLMGTVAYSL
jgi:hypothetical protein